MADKSFTDRQVAALVKPGRYRVARGLYLIVLSPTSRSWALRYMVDGKSREMGLGGYPTVALAEAREKALTAQNQLVNGLDPIAERDKERAAKKLDDARSVTFEKAAERYIARHEGGWSNPKHIQQWRNTIRDYATPIIGAMAVQDIATAHIIRVLDPIWAKKTETATRLRQRIEAILDWAAVMGYRQGENPARWKGHLQNALPKPSKVKKAGHHAALAVDDLPAFWQRLAAHNAVTAHCLRFVILTACRTGEALGATWAEVDMDKKIWTVPGERMKNRKPHRVPLSDEAIKVLGEAATLKRPDDYIFPGLKLGKPLSNMAMLQQLRRMGFALGEVTMHGFRSTFRDWAAERTAFAREVAEMALAHTIEDRTEAAYRRGDLFEKRAKLMDAWAEFATTPPPVDQSNVVSFKREA